MNMFVKILGISVIIVGSQIAQSSVASAYSCGRNQVYSSSLGQCIPRNAGNGKRVFIPHGCPYNLDKSCIRTQGGLLVQCHCVS